MPESLLLRYALAYAAQYHWPVFPLKPRAKEPLTEHGYKDASTDPETIRDWWAQWPDANIGIPTGIAFFALDSDPRNGSEDSLMHLVHEHGPLRDTLSQTTGGGGYHRLYAPPEGERVPSITELWPGIDIKGEGGYIVVPPSIHPSGSRYEWDIPDENAKLIQPADPWLVMEILEHGVRSRSAGQKPVQLPEKIRKGSQHQTLFRWGCWMRRKGAGEAEIYDALWSINVNRCEAPGPERNIRKLAESICSQFPALADRPATVPRQLPAGTAAHVNGAPAPVLNNSDAIIQKPEPIIQNPIFLAELHAVFARWLYLPDNGAVTVALAAVAANRVDGDPVWPLLVGPPSSGKTEILDSLLGLPDMHPASSLTEAALLSGTARRDRAKDSSGGLLRSVGAFGFIVLKDFTSILSMARETRGPLLAALREVHDGRWTRRLGTDGGRTLEWQGKACLIGGCTPVIDQHHSVMAAMGERFILCRMTGVDGLTQAEHALRHVGKEAAMRSELRESVQRIFAGISLTPFAITDAALPRLSSLCSLVARCRSAVERDSYKHEIELIPESELPARIAITLARLMHGMALLGVAVEEQWRLIVKVALDCIPDLRRRILIHLLPLVAASTTSSVALAVQYPTVTTRRALEDLAAHGVISRFGRGQGRTDEWEISSLSSNLASAAGLGGTTLSEK